MVCLKGRPMLLVSLCHQHGHEASLKGNSACAGDQETDDSAEDCELRTTWLKIKFFHVFFNIIDGKSFFHGFLRVMP